MVEDNKFRYTVIDVIFAIDTSRYLFVFCVYNFIYVGRKKRKEERKDLLQNAKIDLLLFFFFFFFLWFQMYKALSACSHNCSLNHVFSHIKNSANRSQWTPSMNSLPRRGFCNSWKSFRSIFLGFWRVLRFSNNWTVSLTDKRVAVLFLEGTEICCYRRAREVVEKWKEKNVWEVREGMRRGERSGARKVQMKDKKRDSR